MTLRNALFWNVSVSAWKEPQGERACSLQRWRTSYLVIRRKIPQRSASGRLSRWLSCVPWVTLNTAGGGWGPCSLSYSAVRRFSVFSALVLHTSYTSQPSGGMAIKNKAVTGEGKESETRYSPDKHTIHITCNSEEPARLFRLKFEFISNFFFFKET